MIFDITKYFERMKNTKNMEIKTLFLYLEASTTPISSGNGATLGTLEAGISFD
jgi:hypothetical protein